MLNGSGEGTTASVLCGMEKLLQDGIAYNAANAPKKIRAIVNLSLGVNGRSDALDKVAYEMTAVGYTVVIAAGDNDGACVCIVPPKTHLGIVLCILLSLTRVLLLAPTFFSYKPIHRQCLLLLPLH